MQSSILIRACACLLLISESVTQAQDAGVRPRAGDLAEQLKRRWDLPDGVRIQLGPVERSGSRRGTWSGAGLPEAGIRFETSARGERVKVGCWYLCDPTCRSDEVVALRTRLWCTSFAPLRSFLEHIEERAARLREAGYELRGVWPGDACLDREEPHLVMSVQLALETDRTRLELSLDERFDLYPADLLDSISDPDQRSAGGDFYIGTVNPPRSFEDTLAVAELVVDGLPTALPGRWDLRQDVSIRDLFWIHARIGFDDEHRLPLIGFVDAHDPEALEFRAERTGNGIALKAFTGLFEWAASSTRQGDPVVALGARQTDEGGIRGFALSLVAGERDLWSSNEALLQRIELGATGRVLGHSSERLRGGNSSRTYGMRYWDARCENGDWLQLYDRTRIMCASGDTRGPESLTVGKEKALLFAGAALYDGI